MNALRGFADTLIVFGSLSQVAVLPWRLPDKKGREKMAEAAKTESKKVVGKVVRGTVYLALTLLITRALFGGRTPLDPVSRLRDLGAF